MKLFEEEDLWNYLMIDKNHEERNTKWRKQDAKCKSSIARNINNLQVIRIPQKKCGMHLMKYIVERAR